MIGNESPCESGPCQRCTSVPQSVDAAILINNEPGSRSGMDTRSMVKGLLCAVMTAARQVSIRMSSCAGANVLNRSSSTRTLQRQLVKRFGVAPEHRRLIVFGEFAAFQQFTGIVLAAFVCDFVREIRRVKKRLVAHRLYREWQG